MPEGATGWRDCLAEGRLPRFALICLAVWLNAADSLVTATIMPSVGAELGGYAFFGWAVAGFFVGAIVAGASAGRLSEVAGLRRATCGAGLTLALGCALSAAAPNIEIFLVGRIVQGIGAGWISGFAMVAIALLFPRRHLARVFAAVSGVWGIATILGPLVGGLFATNGGWRIVFWSFAAQAVIFAVAAPFLLAGTVRDPQRSGMPWRQLALLTLAVAIIAIADMASSIALAVTLVVLGAVLLALVLVVDEGAHTRLMPRGSRDLGSICGSAYLSIFALTAASMGLTVYGPTILQELRGLSPLFAGYVVAAEALAWTLAAFCVAGISDTDGERRWIRGGALCVLLGTLLLMLVMGGGSLPMVVLASAVLGAGFGLSSSLTNRRVIGVLASDDKAIGSSALIAVRQIGNAVGAVVAGVTANLVGFSAGLSDASARSAAFWVFAAALPLAAAGVWAAYRMTDPLTPAASFADGITD
jgi:MFS family permease